MIINTYVIAYIKIRYENIIRICIESLFFVMGYFWGDGGMAKYYYTSKDDTYRLN